LKKLTILSLNVYFVVLFTGLSAGEQPAPQTARQALLEMFFSKTPGTFEKHLPRATRAALPRTGTTSGIPFLYGFSMLTSQMATRGQQLQTFEAGPTLLHFEDPQTHSKFEIIVERDDLRGDEDQIDLSFHGSKNGEPQTAGAKLGLTFIMKQEAGIWRLNEISLTVGVSLTDPEFLQALATKLKPGISEGTPDRPATSVDPNAMMMIAVNESAAVAAVRVFLTAEISYNATFPAHGFTCTLADLGGMGSGGGMSEHQAMLIDPRLASGKKNGYVFALTGCNGTPATSYSITAEPANPAAGTRAFCSDESHVIRFSADGKANSCLNAGTPLQ
jgi:hypothetical protein